MAFGFLDAVGLASAGIGMFRGIKGPDEPEGMDELRESARRSADIARALGQPDLGEYSHLIDQEQGQINRETSTALRALQDADRASRVRSASGLGILQSDRRDETIAREAIRARETSRDAARSRAREYLTGALQANNIAMGGFDSASRVGAVLSNESFKRGSSVLDLATQAAPKLEGLFDKLSPLLNGTPTRFNLPTQAASRYQPPFIPQQAAMTYQPPFTPAMPQQSASTYRPPFSVQRT